MVTVGLEECVRSTEYVALLEAGSCKVGARWLGLP